MKTHLIRIGNSRGIRIPKPILDQCRLGDEIDLEVRGGGLVLRPAHRPRAGWAEAFRRMAEAGDDELLDLGVRAPAAWDRKEWKW